MWREGSPLLVGVKIGAASVENNMEVSKKEEEEDPATSILSIYPKEWKTHLKRHMHPHVQCSIIYSGQDMEGPHMPEDVTMDKE